MKAIRVLAALGFVLLAYLLWPNRGNAAPTLQAQCNQDMCVVPREELEAFVKGSHATMLKLQEKEMKCWWRNS